MTWPDPNLYPDPAYPGGADLQEPPWTSPRRFWIGPVYNQPWPDINLRTTAYTKGVEIATCHPANTTYIDLLAGATIAMGQSFNSGAGGVVRHVAFYFGSSGTPAGYAYAKIYTHSGTFGTSSVPGTLLATSDPLDTAPLYTQWHCFTFSGAEQITLDPDTQYVVVMEHREGVVTLNNYNRVSYKSAGSHAGNACTLNDTTETWTADATKEVPFGIYAVPGGEFIPGETLNINNDRTATYLTDRSVTYYGTAQIPNRFELDFSHVSGDSTYGTESIGYVMTGMTSGVTGVMTQAAYANHTYVYMNYQVPWDAYWPDVDSGVPVAINTADPLNSYIDMLQYQSDGLPEWQTGCMIYDNMGFAWTVVLPYNAAERALYIYPDPPDPTTKIYYDKAALLADSGSGFTWYPEVAGAGSVAYVVDANNPNAVWNSYWSWGVSGAAGTWKAYSIITEVGEDEYATWFKYRPVMAADPDSDGHDWPQVRTTAATFLSVGRLSGGGSYSWPIVIPQAPPVASPSESPSASVSPSISPSPSVAIDTELPAITLHDDDTIEIYNMPASATGGIGKDFGVDYFDDFEIDIESKVFHLEYGALNLALIFSNVNPPGYTSSESLYIGWWGAGYNVPQLMLGTNNGATEERTTAELLTGKLYYLRVRRNTTDNVITLKIYDHESRVPAHLVETLSIPYFATKFRYLAIGCAGREGGTAKFMGWHRNLELNKRLGISTQSAFQFRLDNGDESAASWIGAYDTDAKGPLPNNLRLRIQVDANPVQLLPGIFNETQWYLPESIAITGGISITGGEIFCSLGSGAQAAYRGIPRRNAYWYDFSYSWQEAWAQGSSTYVMLGALYNSEAPDTECVVSFAINTATGKVGVIYTDDVGVQTVWTAVDEGPFENEMMDFSTVTVCFVCEDPDNDVDGMIVVWYNDELIVNLTEVVNSTKGSIDGIAMGNFYSDGDVTGVLNVFGVHLWRPYVASGQFQLEYKLASESDYEWKKVTT